MKFLHTMRSPLQHNNHLFSAQLKSTLWSAWAGSIAPGDAQGTSLLPKQEKTTYGLVKEG